MKKIKTNDKIYELLRAVGEAEKRREYMDKTSTLELINEKDSSIGENIKEIIKNHKDDLVLTKLKKNEMKTVESYISLLKDVINQDMTMCKVVPKFNINSIINLEMGLGGFFTRKADIDKLLEESNDYYETLYEGLRLDYDNSKFTLQDDYMGMLIVRLPEFSLRTPVSSNLQDDNGMEKRIIRLNLSEPFSGIGFICNERCLPEFYISIDTKSDSTRFPQEAFSAKLMLIGHNTEIIDFASYDAGDFNCAPDEKFNIDDRYRDLAIENGWI